MRFLAHLMLVLVCVASKECNGQSAQDVVDYLAHFLRVDWTVLDNINTVGEFNNQWTGQINLTNTGDETIEDTTWEIYFCSIRLFEWDILRHGVENGVELGSSGIEVFHVVGCLHKLAPMDSFEGFLPNEVIELPFKVEEWSIARTDTMPQWYVASTEHGVESRVITSTAGQSLDFVADFTTPEQWKRRDYDQYNPFSPEERYELTGVEDIGHAAKSIIPTPVWMNETDNRIRIDTGDWLVVYASDDVRFESEYLAGKLGTIAVSLEDRPASRYVQLDAQAEAVSPKDNTEAYSLKAVAREQTVIIAGNSAAGAFYGAQSLLSMAYLDGTLPECEMVDYPRFSYRGIHVDVSRNFRTKEEILQLLDTMSMYKLNKFHFHLTDDEGWRLEIPGIPELTEVGARRCHDPDELNCLLPQLGSAPIPSDSGSGFYSVAEYQEILQYADHRHIEVIPEFDMPGHGHAPIRSMEARSASGNADYVLVDPDDDSQYISAQLYRANAINPCLDTTYNFVATVMDEIILMHEDIQPLKLFNYGGDETPEGAWENSTACQLYAIDNDIENTRDALKEWFAVQVANLAYNRGLHFGGWEDGLMEDRIPYNRSIFENEIVRGWTWNNLWESGGGNNAYNLANNDYQVVLSHATHLYFDQPYEPDPEERGYYWATRYTDTRKTFAYIPDDIYKNIDVTRFGQALEGYCEENECVPLDEEKRHNILGIQGELWSETMRTRDQFEAMLFPRLLALAERAWHKAAWESQDDMEEALQADWRQFANTLGYKELKRLDDLGISYHIPPPGARFVDENTVEASTMYPGLPIQYSLDGGDSWIDYTGPVSVDTTTELTLIVRSSDRSRSSRAITVDISRLPKSRSNSQQSAFWLLLLTSMALRFL